MATDRELLDQILAYAAERGIVVPADVLLDIGKADMQELIDNLPKPGEIDPNQLPIYTLVTRGAVPPPLKTGLMLTSSGWEKQKSGGVVVSPGSGRYHDRLNNLAFADSGHTGFQAQDAILDTLAALADGSGVLTNNGLGVLTWGSAGITDHSALSNLTYAAAGHTGFQPTLTGAAALALLLTVDGTGSLLDADLLDGHDTAYFQTAIEDSADLAAALSDETGTGLSVFNAQPTLINPAETCQTLTYGATINWDLNSGGVAYVKLTGDASFAAPTNMRAGAVYTLYVQQDDTGGWAATWADEYLWDNNRVPVLNTSARAMSVFGFFSESTYMFGVSNTPQKRGIEDAVVCSGDVVTTQGEIVWN